MCLFPKGRIDILTWKIAENTKSARFSKCWNWLFIEQLQCISIQGYLHHKVVHNEKLTIYFVMKDDCWKNEVVCNKLTKNPKVRSSYIVWKFYDFSFLIWKTTKHTRIVFKNTQRNLDEAEQKSFWMQLLQSITRVIIHIICSLSNTTLCHLMQ